MPHFGLMDEGALGPVEGPLMRAKLHIRCGRRRLREGKISLGIITLYDALNSAMQWYVAAPGNKKGIHIQQGEDLRDDRTVFRILSRSGVLDGSFDYESFSLLSEQALYEDMTGYDHAEVWKGVESVMEQLGVLPFDESDLPPEDPSTV